MARSGLHRSLRGLDYYTRTVFPEFTPDEIGAAEAGVAGGGALTTAS